MSYINFNIWILPNCFLLDHFKSTLFPKPQFTGSSNAENSPNSGHVLFREFLREQIDNLMTGDGRDGLAEGRRGTHVEVTIWYDYSNYMIGYRIIYLLFTGWILIEEIRDFDNQTLRDEILIKLEDVCYLGRKYCLWWCSLSYSCSDKYLSSQAGLETHNLLIAGESVSPAMWRLWVRVPLGNSDIFLSKNSSKNSIINEILIVVIR